VIKLRTFAVLFQSSNTNCNDNTLWIASVILVVSFVVASSLAVVVYYQSKAFRSIVGGFKTDGISTIIEKVLHPVLEDCHISDFEQHPNFVSPAQN